MRQYLTPKLRYHIGVWSSTGRGFTYRAFTNDNEFYFAHCVKLPWRDSEADAQADLDALAKELDLTPAPPKEQRR